MSTVLKRKFKWFWLWQDRQQEEWLRQMSLQGWHLKSFTRLVFVFEQGPPRDYNYCLDFFNKAGVGFFSTSSGQIQEYVSLLDEAGWERIGHHRGWQYLRRPAELDGPDRVYTDIESKIQLYKRILWFIVLSTPVILVIFLPNLDRYPPWFAGLLLAVWLIGLFFGGLNFVMVLRRIRQLESEA